MKMEKNDLYLGVVAVLVMISLVMMQISSFAIIIFAILLLVAIYLLIIRVKNTRIIEDERSVKISEKASERTVVVYIFGTIILFCIQFPIARYMYDISGETPVWLGEFVWGMFQNALIVSAIYIIFFAYYRYVHSGVIR